MSSVTVAIPVRDGGPLFAELLDALSLQTVEHELLVCDSGSSDGSAELARAHGARVVGLAPEQFSHGGVRNLLVGESASPYVALLTQDAIPADQHWLEHLLEGFSLAPEVAIAFGPYRPRADASLAVRIELEGWFQSLSPGGLPTVERLDERERLTVTAAELAGRRGFFSDANGCVLRAAWEQVPYRPVAYAEDRALAMDMLRAGYAKAFMPQAAVVHSHAYTPVEQLRRSFDEWRGLLEVYGLREPADTRHLVGRLRGALGSARAQLAGEQLSPLRRAAALAGVAGHQLAGLSGAVLGSRADRLPAGIRRRLSLMGSAGFSPLAPEDPRGADRAEPT